MRSKWKRLAEVADKEAYSQADVLEALPIALMQDFRFEVSPGFLLRLAKILEESQQGLFENPKVAQLKEMRIDAYGHPFQCLLLDYSISAAENGSGLAEALSRTLADRALRGSRQVEEHYLRETRTARAINVGSRIDNSINTFNFDNLARRILSSQPTNWASSAAKKTGIDDGVAFR